MTVAYLLHIFLHNWNLHKSSEEDTGFLGGFVVAVRDFLRCAQRRLPICVRMMNTPTLEHDTRIKKGFCMKNDITMLTAVAERRTMKDKLAYTLLARRNPTRKGSNSIRDVFSFSGSSSITKRL